MFKIINDEYAQSFANIVTDLSPHQVCVKCDEMKPYSAFYKNKKSRNGLLGTCKTCISTKKREVRVRNKALGINKDKIYREKNKSKILSRRKQ
jgi:hypothetical protein